MRSPSQRQQSLEKYFAPAVTDPLKLEARKASVGFGKDGISMSEVEARVVAFFIRQKACRKFVEIGTLTGFSALSWFEAMGNQGELWTFEKDPEHARAAREIFNQHPQGKQIHLLEGDAAVELSKIEDQGPFDGIFIDGNKAAYGKYLEWGLKNVRSGGLFALDNVLLGGSVLGEENSKFSPKQIHVMNSVNQCLQDPMLFDSVFIPTEEGLFLGFKK